MGDLLGHTSSSVEAGQVAVSAALLMALLIAARSTGFATDPPLLEVNS
jgi:hypothetical protein